MEPFCAFQEALISIEQDPKGAYQMKNDSRLLGLVEDISELDNQFREAANARVLLKLHSATPSVLKLAVPAGLGPINYLEESEAEPSQR